MSLTDDEHTEAAVNFLREQGFIVEKPIYRETPAQLAKRLRVSPQKLSTDMRHPRRPYVELDKYPSGRVRLIASNSIFEAFVRSSHRGRRVRASEVKS